MGKENYRPLSLKLAKNFAAIKWQGKELMNIEPQGIYAVIPARGGSKSVPKKNIRSFRGHPLIAYTIAAAKLSRRIHRVIVSTDSEEIAAIARAYGAETPFLRPAEFARDHSPDSEVIKHALGWLAKNEECLPTYLAHLRPTTPIRDPAQIDSAIALIQADPAATSLRSAHLCAHPPYKWFAKSEDGYMRPLFPGMTNDQANEPRQGFPAAFVPNGYVDVLKSGFVLESGLLHGEKMIGYLTEEIPDIDTESDFGKLEAYPALTKDFNTLKKYLDAISGNSI